MGPGTIIGSENKQILVKHGGMYIKVYPYHIQLYHSNSCEILSDNVRDMENNSADSLIENAENQSTRF